MMIRGYNFKYCTDYDFDTHTDCHNHGCDDEGICRCGTIEDAHVVSVNISHMVSEIKSAYFDNSKSSQRNSKINSVLGNITEEIDTYTIDRILRINGAFETSNWEVQVCGGYYGQEIDDIILEDSIATKIENQLSAAFDITDLTKRIEYLLTLEYGYILPELKDCKYEVDTVLRDKVIFGSEGQYRKVATEKLPHYSDKNYDSFRGIVIPKSDQYRLIDGYHRCFASENMKIKVLKAIKNV